MDSIASERASIFNELRRRRHALKMTLVDLSARCGLSPNYIGTVESGMRDPSFCALVSLARGLGMEPGELFAGGGGHSAAAIEAAKLFETLPPQMQGAIRMLMLAASKA